MGLFGCSHKWEEHYDGYHRCEKCGKTGEHNWVSSGRVFTKSAAGDGADWKVKRAMGQSLTRAVSEQICNTCGATQRW